MIEHVVERARHVADLVAPRARDPRREVAAADPLGGVLDRADRAHEAAREQPRREQRERERDGAREREVHARVAQRRALRAEVGGDAQLEPRQRCDDARELLARLRRLERERRAAQVGPARDERRVDRVDRHEAAERTRVRAQLGDRDEVGLARVRRQRALRRGDCGREQLRVARGRDRAAVAVDERDQPRALAPLQVARVVGERGRVLDLEVGAQLRRAGDGAVALRERGLVRRDELARGARGAVEPRRGGALEVARERAVLERERDRARERDETREREQQPEPDRPPEATARRAVARARCACAIDSSPPSALPRPGARPA